MYRQKPYRIANMTSKLFLPNTFFIQPLGNLKSPRPPGFTTPFTENFKSRASLQAGGTVTINFKV